MSDIELNELRVLEINRPRKSRGGLINDIDKRLRSKSSGNDIVETDIDLFHGQHSKNCNDKNNKKRESIIKSFARGNIFPGSEPWSELYNKFTHCMVSYLSPGQDQEYSYEIIGKAGRTHHYDFLITFYDGDKNFISEHKIEFKHNACHVNDCPQFVSPMYPSKFFDGSYEGVFYSDYLSDIFLKVGATKPLEEVYLKQIHKTTPDCMSTVQVAYYRGSPQSSKYTGLESDIDNYKFMKKQSALSIDKYLKTFTLDITKMNEYLLSSQKDKKYLLWSGSDFHYQEVDEDDYTIDSDIEVSIQNKNTLVYKTKSKKDIKIMLRWKNGNGVAFPALQIS
tara:strand:- start:337 stop:1347 length:1011 start_codon:yes stop_codon:yes gene_type:complete